MTSTPAHTADYRVRFELDPDAQFEECNGEPRPLTEVEYRENYYNAPNGQPVSYAEYLAYYGNPDKHRYIGVVIDLVCACCESVTTRSKASLWNIDLMIDNPEWLYIRRKLGRHFSPDEMSQLPGYLAEVARETLNEAGYK